MQRYIKLTSLTILAALLLVLGGLFMPNHPTTADEQHYIRYCPDGVTTHINGADGTVTCGDGTPANMTPDTPAPQSTAAPVTPVATPTEADPAPNCH